MKVTKTPSGGLWVNSTIVTQPGSHDWFDPTYWEGRGLVLGDAAGRGSVIFVQHDTQQWALRHYQRGGLIGRFNHDRYLYTGQSRVRSVAEMALLLQLAQWGLPSANPVAAAWTRSGPWYRADLITRRIEYEQTLAQLLAGAAAPNLAAVLGACGETIAQFHSHGVDHADLNCHNVLLATGQVHIIDFDRGRLRVPGRWQRTNLRRLRRSADKVVSSALRPGLAQGWAALEQAYLSALPASQRPRSFRVQS